ncbi:DUF1992 domain-containing protein [Lentibacillus lipolyticus]|nr:DUF1992 domain-containing protein [Lentibacillus lipolyticus]
MNITMDIRKGDNMYLIVEDKIREAIEKGELDDLPGKGKRLHLRDDLPGMSREMNQAYKILKNAGFVPDDTTKNKKNVTSKDLLEYATGEEYNDATRKTTQFNKFVKKRKLDRNAKFPSYRQKLLKKFF